MKILKLNKKPILSTLAVFLSFGAFLNVNAAYSCGYVKQDTTWKVTPSVSNYKNKDYDYKEYLTGAGELDGAVFCITPYRSYVKNYKASCIDTIVNLYRCAQGKDPIRCGYARSMQKYINSSKGKDAYFQTMYWNRYFRMDKLPDKTMTIYGQGVKNVYYNTLNQTGNSRFTSGAALSVANEYRKVKNDYSKSVWYSKAEKWTADGGKFKTIAVGQSATVTIDTKGALDFTNKKSSLTKYPIVLTGSFMKYFNIKDIKTSGSKITFKLVIKDHATEISNEISKNGNLSKVLKVQVNFKDVRDIKAVVQVQPTNYQSYIQLYETYKVKSSNVSCGPNSEAKNDCPDVPTGGNPDTCKDLKDTCDSSKNNNSEACKKYHTDCCDDIQKACDEDKKNGKTEEDSDNCQDIIKYCTKTTDSCNDLDAAKAGKVVKSPKDGNNTFNHDVWEWLDKNGTEQQKVAYKQYCPCNCDSSAADISSGACDLTGGGKYDEDKYNQITDDSKKAEYITACSPCDFDDENAIACSAGGSCDEGDSSIGKVEAKYDENKLIACANAEGAGSSKNYNQDIFKDKTPAVCYETYDIYYKEAKISSGINTAIGVTRYLKFQANTDKLLNNTIRIEAKKTCYVKGSFTDIESKAKETSTQYSKAPTLSFTYDEGIPNEGFYDYSSENANTVVESTSDSKIQKLTATKSYIYEPATQYSVDVLNGKFYYTKHDKDSDLTNDLLAERPSTGDENIKYIGDTKNTDNSKGRVFPIKFTTQAQKPDENGNIPGYKYSIDVKEYKIDEKSINHDLTEVSNKNTKCTNKFSCKYVISRKDCKQSTPTCDYVCMRDVPESEKATSPYCSEVCSCTDETSSGSGKTNASAVNFVYTTVSTDNVLSTSTTDAVGENWLTEKGQQTIKDIEEAAKKGETYKTSIVDVELDGNKIKEIIESIKANNGYISTDNESCKNKIKDSEGKETEVWYCTSKFLRELGIDTDKLDASYGVYGTGENATAWK